jgi:cytochrome b subunit of formate dehydrogenase
LSAAFSYAKFPALAMAESAYLPAVTIQNSEVLDSPRHSALVRVTHWIHTLSFIALALSGIAILLAHPRLYWGETGAVGTPSLIDLPFPFVLELQIRGPGRYLHFLSAWVCVLTRILQAVGAPTAR